jgi:hypothetical protein
MQGQLEQIDGRKLVVQILDLVSEQHRRHAAALLGISLGW